MKKNIIIVLTALAIFAQPSFSSKIYGQSNESVTKESESAIIILSTDTVSEMQTARKILELNGVDIIDIFPPRVFIGKGAKTVFEALKEADFIEQVSDELLDETIFESYEPSVKGAVTFWNQRLKNEGYRIAPSQADKRRRVAPQRKEEEPFQDELIIRDDFPKTEEERIKKEGEYRNTWRQLKEELRLREEEKKAKRRLRKKAPAKKGQTSSITPLRQPAPILYSQDQAQTNLFGKASSGGAGYYDTSLYMAGDIAVGVFFESGSNGNWTNQEIDETFANICNALNQFKDDEPNANICFTFIKEIDEDSGVPKLSPGYELERDYVNNLRNTYNTHWAYIIIVYKGSGRANASYFGPSLRLYSDGLRSARHETMHIFGAMDQYHPDTAKSPVDRWGYLNVINANSQYNDGKGYFQGAGEGLADIMIAGGPIGVYSRGQIGWRDSDGDGILDPLDTFPDTVILSKTGINPLAYTGKTQDKPLLCEFFGNLGSVTLNTIKSVEYRINNGAWCEAIPSDGAYDSAEEGFSFTVPSLANGDYTVEVRAINSVNNAETSYAKDKLQIKGSSFTNVRPTAAFSITPQKGSTETNFSFDANLSSDIEDEPSNLYTRWDFENDGVFDTSFSQNKSVVHKYTTPNLKTVKLEVRDRLGLIHTITKQIEVAASDIAPQAFFTVSPENAHSDSKTFTVSLNAQGSYDGEAAPSELKFRWDFEDDGLWDTEYLDSPIIEHAYALPVKLISITPLSTLGLGGNAYGILVLGNYLYVAAGDLKIIDISNPLAPESVGTCVTPGYVTSVYVVDNFAYVADGSKGLQIIDISEPSYPVIKAGSKFIDNFDFAFDIEIQGNYAYISSGSSGLEIIDISNPLNPVLKANYDTEGYAFSVFLSSNCAYVADGSSGLLIIDVTNPEAPILKASCKTKGIARDVYIAGDYAYITSIDAGLEIIDISNPSNPIRKTNFYVNGIANKVFVFGNYAYVSTYNSGLYIFDISDPLKPDLKALTDTFSSTSSVYVRDNHAYVTGGIKEPPYSVVSIFDLTQMSNNSETKYIFNHMSKHWRCRLEVKDSNDQISQAIRDVWKVTYNHPPIADNMEIKPVKVFSSDILSRYKIVSRSIPRIYGQGNYAYLYDNSNILGIEVIDISEPLNLRAAGNISTNNSILNCYVSGNYLYFLDWNVLRIFDITDVKNPIPTGSRYIPGFICGICGTGNYAYVAGGSSGLHIVDVSNPANPILKTTYNLSNFASQVYASGNYLYVVDGSSGFHIIDISNPLSPVLKSSCNLKDHAVDVYILDSYAYVAIGSSGLQVIDISNPSQPILTNSFNVNGAYKFHVLENYAYVIDRKGSLEIIDISNPLTPTLKGICDINAGDVYVSDNHVFVVTQNELLVVKLKSSNGSAVIGVFDSDQNTLWDGLLEYRWDFDDDGVWDTKYSAAGNETLLPVGVSAVTCEVKDRFNAVARKTVTFDMTPPAGSIKINNGAQFSGTASVTLNISATDTESGMDQMKLSNDDLSYSEAEPYTAAKPWTLAAGGGKKAVYAKFSDKAGNWSTPYSDGIILDTSEPPLPKFSRAEVIYNKLTKKFNLYASLYSQRDPESGPVRYKYSVTQGSPTGPVIKDWSFATRLDSSGSAIRVLNLSLTKGKIYYFNVKAVNRAGLESSVSSSLLRP